MLLKILILMSLDNHDLEFCLLRDYVCSFLRVGVLFMYNENQQLNEKT